MNIKEASNLIPKNTPYCYTHDKNGKCSFCPFWSINKDHEEQNNGYCSFLKVGDWEGKGLSLLWDQVKECGINE